MSAWNSVYLAVKSITEACRLWQDCFGFEPVEIDLQQSNKLFSRLGIPADGINKHLRLSSPNQNCGQVHLLELNDPAPAIRDGAQNFDLCAKNLDVYVDDIAARLPALRAAGCQFRNENFSEVTAPNGIRFREIHLHAHDEINVVILQLVDHPMLFSNQGYCGVGALVSIVEEPTEEAAFYQQQLTCTETMHHVLDGPEIEQMVGLPTGANLDIRILGEPENHMGQVEIIRYGGLRGNDLYPKSGSIRRGVVAMSFAADHMKNQTSEEVLISPAGFRIIRDPFS